MKKLLTLYLGLLALNANAAILSWDLMDMAFDVPVVYNVYRADIGSTNWVKVATVSTNSWKITSTNVCKLAVSSQYAFPNVPEVQPESELSSSVIFFPSLNTVTNVKITLTLTIGQ